MTGAFKLYETAESYDFYLSNFYSCFFQFYTFIKLILPLRCKHVSSPPKISACSLFHLHYQIISQSTVSLARAPATVGFFFLYYYPRKSFSLALILSFIPSLIFYLKAFLKLFVLTFYFIIFVH